jgi:alpha-glucosidase
MPRPDPRPAAHGVHGADLPTAAMRLVGVDGPVVHFACAHGGTARARLSVLDHDLLRLEVLPTGRPAQARTWAIVGDDGDVPPEGRDRADVARFPAPAFEVVERDGEVAIRTEQVTARVRLAPLGVRIERPDGTPLWRDLEHGAHGHLPGRGVRWTWRRDDREVLYGLGEATGPLDRSRRRFRLRPLDALAYDARTGDPLYKHLPVLLTRTPDAGAIGLLVDTAAEAIFDLGAEVDNYHGPYRYLEVGEEALDAWFLTGPTLADVHARILDLTGRPPIPPRWTLGYLASTMGYTDAEDPTAAFEGFAADLERHGIGCSAMHLSSGYSLSDEGLRYVFAWNRRRVPDPAAMIAPLRGAGLRTIANLKPALLTTHPDFADLAARGLLVREADADRPYLSRFWDGEGGYLDLSHPDAYRWWMERVRTRILDVGIDVAWNDNNEFQIWDEAARTHAGPARGLRPVLTQLMIRASRDAQRAHDPERRAWTLTRSGMLGSWRYAQTWTGDNHSDWTTLRFNVPMGLNLSLSGWSSMGHDVGGFAGPMPDAELLLRWIEHGVGMPRFVIHSWNDDGSITEQWSHPEILPQVRTLTTWRERLLPYLYGLAWRSRVAAEPILRPLPYAFPDWRPGWREDLVHLLGPALLIAPVVEPGVEERPVHLPPGRWLELATGTVHDGETEVVAWAPPGTPAWFLREGHAIPVAHEAHAPAGQDRGQDAATLAELLQGGVAWGARGGVTFLAHPDPEGRARGALIWDDGVSRAHERGAWDRIEVEVLGDRAVARGAVGSGMGVPRVDVRVPGGAGEDARTPPWAVRWRELPVDQSGIATGRPPSSAER